MRHIPFVRTCLLIPFIEVLKDRGAPVERLLNAARVPAWTLEKPEALTPLPAALSFIEKASCQEGMECLGLIAGHKTPIHRLGDFGALINNSLTLYDALLTSTRMIGCIDSSLCLKVERHGDSLWVYGHRLESLNGVISQANQYLFMLILNLIRQVAGSNWKPEQIHWQMPINHRIASHEFFDGLRQSFNKPATALVLPMELACRPLSTLPKGNGQYPAEAADRLLATAPAQDFAGSIEQLLRIQLKGHPPSLIHSAEMAGLSPRTLQRRLRDERREYSRLCEKIRFEWAVNLLQEPKIKLTDIAQDLGYSDSPNFNRAFRRWTGVTPSEFRRQLLERD